jgi:hypothetical protein
VVTNTALPVKAGALSPPVEEGGMMDPYPGIVADKGKFIIQFFGGSNWKGTWSMLFEFSPTDKDWLLTRQITESYYLDKRNYKSDTSLVKDHGKILFTKEYCNKKSGRPSKDTRS